MCRYVAALVAAFSAENAKSRTRFESHREAKGLSFNTHNTMLQELVEIDGRARASDTIVGVCLSAFINMFYPPLSGNLSTFREPKLNGIGVQCDLANLFAH
jgi:hypothetical protein